MEARPAVRGVAAALLALLLAGATGAAAQTLTAGPALNFGGQSMGTRSPTQNVTVTNTGSTPITVSSVTVSAGFSQTNTCATLAAAATCTITVTFAPAPAAGAINSTVSVTGQVTITSNATGSPHLVNVSGTAEKSLVTHFYRSILRRAPDAGGKTFWDGEATRLAGLGVPVNEVWFAMAQNFYGGAEYTALARNDTGFVTDLYNTFFNRPPDSGGLSFWTGQLASGMPRGVALVSFMFSNEFLTLSQSIFGTATGRPEVDTVMDFYRGLLNRVADSNGFNFWLQRFRVAQCTSQGAVNAEVEAISSAFATSAEYSARNRTNAQYVGDLYNAFLRRGGDLTGVQFWINQLATGARTRENVRQQFLASPEFSARVQNILAQGCLGPSSVPHPRVWLGDQATLNRLVAAANANSPEWTRLKTFCDTRTLGSTGSEYQGSEPLKFGVNFALCYRVVRQISGATAANAYAQKAVNILTDTTIPLLNFTNYSRDQGYGIRNYVPALALIFDWLYDSPLLTASLKSQIISRINDWLNWYAANGYTRNDPIANYNTGYLLARVVAAVALYGEDTTSAAIYSGAVNHLTSAFATFDSLLPGGHWPEGWSYGNNVYASALMSAAALRIFTNDPAYTSSLWLTRNVPFKMSALAGDGRFFYNDGLWSAGNDGRPHLFDMMTAGYAFGWSSNNGRIARSYLDLVLAGGTQSITNVEEWKVFLFYDPTATPANLTQLPLSHNAEGTDTVVMRSDWTSTQGTWASFVTGPYLSTQTEQDMDQGNIQIHKSARLLIDVSHEYYNLSNTADHNTYTFEGRTDATYGGQFFWHMSCPNPLGTNPIGQNAYHEGVEYAFVSGEFSAAYQIRPVYPATCGAIPVTWINRSLLYVRPNVFVVYDQMRKQASQPNLVPTQHWHFQNQPTMQPGTNNRQLTIDNGTGRLHFASVLPLNTNTDLAYNARNTVGGPGVANWHLKVTHPQSPSPTYQSYLTVLRAGLAQAGYTFPTLNAIQGTNAQGVLVSGLQGFEAAGPVAAVFADNSALTVPTSLSYQYPSLGTTRNYVSKLKPNTFYTVSATPGATVSVTITEGGSTRSDPAGVLVFTP